MAKAEAQRPPPPLAPGKKKFSLNELKAHAGQQEIDEGSGAVSMKTPILMSVVGRVYDVTSGVEFFGPGGAYEMFAGRDGTYNLGVMSMKKKTLDKFDHTYDQEEKETLADWLAYFDHKYGRPIGELTSHEHRVKLSDLPRATKIPFNGGASADDAEADDVKDAQLASKL